MKPSADTLQKMRALQEARNLGCSGAHKNSNGKWMPCDSHAKLVAIKPERTSTSSIIEINKRQRTLKGTNKIRGQWQNLRERQPVGLGSTSTGGIISINQGNFGNAGGGQAPVAAAPGVAVKAFNAAVGDNDTDVFTDISSARRRAQQLGCIGVSRRISKNGKIVWTPCTNMSDLAQRNGSTSLGRRHQDQHIERIVTEALNRKLKKKKSLIDEVDGTKALGLNIHQIGSGVNPASFVDISGTIDADGDGFVFEGTPKKRPLVPKIIGEAASGVRSVISGDKVTLQTDEGKFDLIPGDTSISKRAIKRAQKHIKVNLGSREPVGDKYKDYSIDELVELAQSSIPASYEEMVVAFKSNNFTSKSAKSIAMRVQGASPYWELSQEMQDIVSNEIRNNPIFAEMVRKYGIPPIVASDVMPSVTPIVPIFYSMWGDTAACFTSYGTISINPDFKLITGNGDSISDILRHELMHAWQSQAAVQDPKARDFYENTTAQMLEMIKRGKGNTLNQIADNLAETGWGTQADLVSAAKISDYATTARTEWIAETFSYLTSSDPKKRSRVDARSKAHLAESLGIQPWELEQMLGTNDIPAVRDNKKKPPFIAGMRNQIPKNKFDEVINWSENNPGYLSDAPDVVFFSVSPEARENNRQMRASGLRAFTTTPRTGVNQPPQQNGPVGSGGKRMGEIILGRVSKDERNKKNPRFWFIGGTPGSGKSSMLEDGLLEGVPSPNEAASIDPDFIKTGLVGWNGGAGASRVHEASRVATDKIMDSAVGEGMDVIVQGTGKRTEHLQKMKKLGYTNIGHFVYVPGKEADRRIASRKEQGGSNIPTYFGSQIAQELQMYVPRQITSGLYDEFYLWDNSGKIPKLIAERTLDGQYKIHDNGAFDDFMGMKGAQFVRKYWADNGPSLRASVGMRSSFASMSSDEFLKHDPNDLLHEIDNRNVLIGNINRALNGQSTIGTKLPRGNSQLEELRDSSYADITGIYNHLDNSIVNATEVSMNIDGARNQLALVDNSINQISTNNPEMWKAIKSSVPFTEFYKQVRSKDKNVDIHELRNSWDAAKNLADTRSKTDARIKKLDAMKKNFDSRTNAARIADHLLSSTPETSQTDFNHIDNVSLNRRNLPVGKSKAVQTKINAVNNAVSVQTNANGEIRTTGLRSAKTEEIYKSVADSLIKAIEESKDGKWERPWNLGLNLPRNATTKKPYKGTNSLIFAMVQQARGYEHPVWGTYKQWQEKGIQVRKGEKGIMGIKWSAVDKLVKLSDGSTSSERRMVPSAFVVFNIDQVDGANPDEFVIPKLSPTERIQTLDGIIKDIGPTVSHANTERAFYSPVDDYINMPPFGSFKSPLDYYTTLAHEMVHWTGHQDRMKRQNMNQFGTPEYAYEELIAEIGSAFFMGILGMDAPAQDNHASYLKSWAQKLKDDPMVLQKASSDAQKAVDFLLKESPELRHQYGINDEPGEVVKDINNAVDGVDEIVTSSPPGMRSRRRDMTESEKERFSPITISPDEKIKLQPGTTLVYADEDNQIIRTELIGPQVARIRGIRGIKLYTDPNPNNQDEVNAQMREWDELYGPISSDKRQAKRNGGQSNRAARERSRNRVINEDPVDRILREAEESRSGIRSKVNSNYPNISRFFSPRDNDIDERRFAEDTLKGVSLDRAEEIAAEHASRIDEVKKQAKKELVSIMGADGYKQWEDNWFSTAGLGLSASEVEKVKQIDKQASEDELNITNSLYDSLTSLSEESRGRRMRGINAARSVRGLKSSTATKIPVEISHDGNYVQIKYGDFKIDIPNPEPTDNNWANAYEKLLSWEGSYYSRMISSALLGLEPPMAHGGKSPKAKLAEAVSTGSSKGLGNYEINSVSTPVYNAYISIERVRNSPPTVRPLYRGMVVDDDSSIAKSADGEIFSMPLTSFTYVELAAKEFAGGSFNSNESIDGTPILIVLEKGAKAADCPNGNEMFRDGYLDAIDDGNGNMIRVPIESVTQGKFKIVSKKKTVLPAGEGWEVHIEHLDTLEPTGSGMRSKTNPPVPGWVKDADISRPINGKPQKDRLRLTDEQKQQIAELNAKGLSDIEIARELGVSKESVIRVRKKQNIPPVTRLRKNRERDKKIIFMVKEGKTHSAIAKELGIHKQSVMHVVLQHAKDTGENYSSFAARDIPRRMRIIELHKMGKNDAEIARELGISPNTVGRIRKDEGLSRNSYKKWNSPSQLGKISSLRSKTEKFDNRFKEKYGQDNPQGDGDCYSTALTLAQKLSRKFKDDKNTQVYVVHGIPLGNGGEAEGIRYGHAWVEVDRTQAEIAKLEEALKKATIERNKTMIEEQIQNLREIGDATVYDYSNGGKNEIPKFLYYAIGNIEESEVRRYQPSEANELASKKKHYGPWN